MGEFSFAILVVSLLAGFTTVFAPCIFTFLPIVLTSSQSGKKSILRPLIVIISMAISIFAFTLLLRASTVLIDVDPTFWEVFAGGIIFTQGIITLFPEIWDKFSVRIGINRRSSELVNDAAKKEGVLGSVFTGIALGPIFSSCSPTYGFIIGAVFQTTPSVAIIYLVTYIIGLSTLLLTIAVLGQNVVSKLKWGTNPHGIFKRLIALLFIILGWSIMFGIHKDVEEFIINNLPFLDATAIDRSLLDRAR